MAGLFTIVSTGFKASVGNLFLLQHDKSICSDINIHINGNVFIITTFIRMQINNPGFVQD